MKVTTIIFALFAVSAITTNASIFSGWKPFRKPLEPANKAGDELSKAISGSKTAPLPPAAKQQVQHIENKAEEANQAYRNAEETLSIQRDNFVLAAIGLCVTNVITLVGFGRDRGRRSKELQKLDLEVKELEEKSAQGRLRRLEELRSKQLISEAEYSRQRGAIVSSL